MVRPGMSRRRALGATIAVLGTGALAGCGVSGSATKERWHNGRLYIATGNTTGVFYQIGGGYADIITAHVSGYEATAEPTSAAVENIRRVVRGEADIGLTFADAAADAVSGRAPFAGAIQPIQALARIYSSYTHVIARVDARIKSLADMRGRRISTSTRGSGTENVAQRLLTAARIDPDRDVSRSALSLPETVKGMKAGTLDAMFWTAGIPTLGITDLLTAMPDRLIFLPVADLLPGLRTVYGQAYAPATIAKAAYGLPSDVPTISVASMIVVRDRMPDNLTYDLTRVLFEYQEDLAKAHPEGRNFTRDAAMLTDPVPLHAGARRFLGAPR